MGRHFRWTDLSGRRLMRPSGGTVRLPEAPAVKSLSLALGGELSFNQESVWLRCGLSLDRQRMLAPCVFCRTEGMRSVRNYNTGMALIL